MAVAGEPAAANLALMARSRDPHARFHELLARRVGERLPADDARELRLHLRRCRLCRRVNDEYRSQRHALRALVPPPPPRDLWARTSLALDREMGREHEPPWTLPGLRRTRRRGVLPAALAGLAAAALAALAVGNPSRPGGSSTTVAAAATPYRVAPQELAFLADEPDGPTVYRTLIREVCPLPADDCISLRPGDGRAIDTPYRSPRSVTLGPRGDTMAISATDEEGRSVVAVVDVPRTLYRNPEVSPAPDRSAARDVQPEGSASPQEDPSGRRASTVAEEPSASASGTTSAGATTSVGATASASATTSASATSSNVTTSEPATDSATTAPSATPEASARSPERTDEPSRDPSRDASSQPSQEPTRSASAPSDDASAERSTASSEEPSGQPSGEPSGRPSGSASGQRSGESSPVPARARQILRGAEITGTPAWSADGQYLAFSAVPADGSHGPDLYLWRAGSDEARRITDDHRTYFASWAGSRIVVSRPASPGEDESARSAEPDGARGSPEADATAQARDTRAASFVLDLDTGDERRLAVPELWLPVVDPTGRSAIVWRGPVATSGWQARPASGRLLLVDWRRLDPFRDAASEGEAPAAPLRGARTLAGGGSEAVADWHVRWSDDGAAYGLWIATGPDGTGELSIVSATASGAPGRPILGPTPARRAFILGVNRAAWLVPGIDGEADEVHVATWGEGGSGRVRIEVAEPGRTLVDF